ncbi:MAG TPA: hypothetical protein VHQ21_04635 [Rhodanobacteraceae bacterium]|nr:hypothetical protein [Rhodanobacteraceae bacterium]
MTSHMPRNIVATPGQVWPGIRIHIIDMVQPPGIGMSCIADIELHHLIVTAVLAANSAAAAPTKERCEAASMWVS